MQRGVCRTAIREVGGAILWTLVLTLTTAASAAFAGVGATPSSTPTSTSTSTPTVTISSTATITPTLTPTPGANDCCQCNNSCGPAVSSTPGYFCGACPVVYGAVCDAGTCVTRTATPTSADTFTPTETPTGTSTHTPTRTLTPTRTDTRTHTPTRTPTSTPTVTPTPFYCCQDNGTCGPAPTPGAEYCSETSATPMVGMVCDGGRGICAVPTNTVVRTSTPTQTPTRTIQAVCTPNGILDGPDPAKPNLPPEQCDDGNLEDGDLCPHDCRYTIPAPNPVHTPFTIRGNGHNPDTDKRGCEVAWFLGNKSNLRRDSRSPNLPNWRQECHAGEACHSSQPGAGGICHFDVVLCLNNLDKDLKNCTPLGVQSVEVLKPTGTDDLSTSNRKNIEAAAGHLLDPTKPFPTPPAAACLDPQPYPTPSYCYGWPINAQQRDLCSEPFSIGVSPDRPVLIKLKAISRDIDNDRISTTVSKLKLKCVQ